MRRGPPSTRAVPRSSLEDPVGAATRLVGVRLVRDDGDGGRRVGRIVEVEAYAGPEDRASHARHGRTARNGAMFGPPGHAYVYRIYGLHDCLNVVTGPDGCASAVLIRAAEPVEGHEAMRTARADSRASRRVGSTVHLARGPGCLGAAFGIDRDLDGVDLCDASSPLRLELPDPAARPPRIVALPRVGVGHAGPPWSALAWRFVDADSPAVSRPRPAPGNR